MKTTNHTRTRRRVVSFDENRDSRSASARRAEWMDATAPEILVFDDDTNASMLRVLAEAAKKALDELTDRQRAAVELRYIEGLTQREIARRWGVSPSAVSRLLARAIARLRRLIIVK